MNEQLYHTCYNDVNADLSTQYLLDVKFKDKRFAAGCSRDVIEQGAERLGVELDKLFADTIEAMRSCEESVNKAMEEYNK